MTDPFDAMLASALAPPEREPDPDFVRRVEARIALERRIAAERAALLRRLAMEVGALAALAVGLVAIAQAPAVAGLAADYPALALAGVLAGFTLLIALLAETAMHPMGIPRSRFALTR